jgi:hypothetical protein
MLASPLAASSVTPSRPTMSVSMTFVIINPTWVSTTGSDKRTTRRSSEEKEEVMENGARREATDTRAGPRRLVRR